MQLKCLTFTLNPGSIQFANTRRLSTGQQPIPPHIALLCIVPRFRFRKIQLISDDHQTHWCVRDTPVLRIICAKLRRFYTSTVDRSIHADFREVPTVHTDFSKRPDLIGFNPFDFPSKSSISGILEGIVSHQTCYQRLPLVLVVRDQYQ